MSLVVSWNDARRDLDGFEFFLARADYRQVGALEKILAPVRHHRDKTLRIHFHQRIAVLGSRFDPFLPILHFTDLRHSALLGGFDELPVIFFRQPLARETAAGHAPE